MLFDEHQLPTTPPAPGAITQARSGLEGGRFLHGKRFYTVLIFPQWQSRFRKLHVSRGFVACILLLGVGLVGAGVASTHLLFRLQTQSMVVEWLQHENAALKQQKETFEVKLDGVVDKVQAAEAEASRLARALELKGVLPSERLAAGGAAAGGPEGPQRAWFDDEVRSILSRTDTVLLSLDRVDSAWQARERLMSATPSLAPVQGWLSHNYGWRNDPFTGEREFHRGIDIVAPTGVPVRAPADGVVVRAGRLSAYGKSVDISHGYGFVTRYGHLSDIGVRAGQRVERGETIGKVGSTGRSTGPHLHYEVFRDGRQVNPWAYLGQSNAAGTALSARKR